MSLLSQLWSDETGVLLSAEAVVVGTVGVVGLTAGATAVSSAVNEELKDMAFAIRSLDQSYEIPQQKSCGAWTAGSSFRQTPVEESLEELQSEIEDAEVTEEKRAKRLRRQLERQDKERGRGKSRKSAERESVGRSEAIVADTAVRFE